MHIVALADAHTVEALSALGVEPYPVSTPEDALRHLRSLVVNKNNVILISAGLAGEIEEEITELDTKYKETVIVVIPDMNNNIEMDIDKMIANVVGVKI